MKIVILHGPGEVSKRAEVLKIKKQFPQDSVAVVDLKQAGLEFLQSVLNSVQLFALGKRLVICENAGEKLDLSKLQGGDDVNLLIVAANPRSDSLLLQTAKKLQLPVLLFEGAKETSVFPFLDALVERKKQALVELEKLLDEYGEMYVLSMIFYLLRRNILPLPLSAFLQKRISEQKKGYTAKDWANLYLLTLETEFKIKSGLLDSRLGLTTLAHKFIFPV